MKHPLLLTLSLCFCGSVWAQPKTAATRSSASGKPTVEFEFSLPVERKKDSARLPPKVSNSYYNRIDFVDSRSWPVIGPTFKGLLSGTPADLVMKQPVGAQLTTIMEALLDSTAGRGELLFQLRRFHYVEDAPTCYCFLLATLYNKTAEGYQKLLTLDTVFVIRGPGILGPLNFYASQAIIDFIGSALTLHPEDSTAYNLYAVNKMDSIDQHRLPLFTDTAWVDGLYTSYQSFSRQLPDRQCMVKMGRDGQIKSVRILDAAGKAVEPRWQDMYAIVYKGQGYISTEYGLCPITRTDNDLLFTGDVWVPPSEVDLYKASHLMGPWRSLASKGWRTTYTMAIDPVNGLFVHLRLIPKQPATN